MCGGDATFCQIPLATCVKFRSETLLLCRVQINGASVVGVTHEEAVSLLRSSHSNVTIVVQRDVASPTTSPDRSSFSGSSPQHVIPEKPTSPVRAVINPAAAGNPHL